MIPYYINTRAERYSSYYLKHNKTHLNFKPQCNYLNTTNERILVRDFYTNDFGLINSKINENFFFILKTEKIQNRSLDKKDFFIWIN